jgi:peptide/nickel transport system substrate-binding protein
MAASEYWSRIAARRLGRRTMLRGAAIGGAGLAGAALIGCGGSDSTSSGDTAGTKKPDASAPAVVAAPRAGGRLNYVIAGDPPSFDLHQESTNYVNHVAAPAYNQLVQVDPMVKNGIETPQAIIPDLAKSWEITPDGQTYVFHLVPNAKFHDGTPFTSADVKASLERQQNPPPKVSAVRQGQLEAIASITTPDASTVTLKMARPVSSLSLLPILGQGWMAMYSKKDIDAGLDFKLKVNGTGPYRFKNYTRGNVVVLDKNPDYWVKDRPYLDGVSIYIVPDASTKVANVQSGQLQLAEVSVTDMKSLQKALGDKAIYQNVASYGFSTMNFGGRKPWDDIRVRRAIVMAHNKDDYVTVVQTGDGHVGGYMSYGGYWALPEEDLRKVPGYEKFADKSITEARKLLDAAGVPNGFETTVLTRLGSENLSTFIVDQLSKIGIKAKLDIQESTPAYDNMLKRNFDLGPWGHAYAVDDPDAVFAEFYTTKAPRNYSALGTPEVDDLFLKQSVEQDPKKRLELVHQLESASMGLYGKMILAWGGTHSVSTKQLNGWVLHNSLYNNQRFEGVWLSA